MKKIILIFLPLLVLTGCQKSNVVEDYNYMPDNSLRIVREDNLTYILIHKQDKYYLLSEEDIPFNIDYIIKLNNNITKKEEYYLKDSLTLDGVTFIKNDKIEVLLDNYTFCIYIKSLDKNNYNTCDFIYLYNPDKDFYITLTSDLLVLIYNSYTKFSYKFLYHLSLVWIDTYTVDTSSMLTLTIKEKDFTIDSHQIRGKTIHKNKKT